MWKLFPSQDNSYPAMRYTLTGRCSHTDMDGAANPCLWLVSSHLSLAVIGQWQAISSASCSSGWWCVLSRPRSALDRRGYISGPLARLPHSITNWLVLAQHSRGLRASVSWIFLKYQRHERVADMEQFVVITDTNLFRAALPGLAWQPGWLGMKNSWQRLLELGVMQWCDHTWGDMWCDPQVGSPVSRWGRGHLSL